MRHGLGWMVDGPARAKAFVTSKTSHAAFAATQWLVKKLNSSVKNIYQSTIHYPLGFSAAVTLKNGRQRSGKHSRLFNALQPINRYKNQRKRTATMRCLPATQRGSCPIDLSRPLIGRTPRLV